MRKTLSVQDIDAIKKFKVSLSMFSKEEQDLLLQINQKINEHVLWINKRIIFWQNELSKAERECETVRGQLVSVNLSQRKSVGSGNKELSELTQLRKRFAELQKEVVTYKKELSLSRSWKSKIEKMLVEFQLSESHLKSFLSESDHKDALALELLIAGYEAILVKEELAAAFSSTNTENLDHGKSATIEDEKELIKLRVILALMQNSLIQERNWSLLSREQKIQALWESEKSIAESQGRHVKEVVVEKMHPTTNGYFDGRAIHINQDMLDVNPQNVVRTILHEGRHAYQKYAVDNPGFHPDQKEVEIWNDNFENYLDVETYGFELYFLQPIEVDARSFSEEICNSFYK